MAQAGDPKFLHKESDFDVAYLSEKKLDLREESKLICDLMPVFKSEKVDLVNLENAGPLLMQQVFKSHKILFCEDMQVYFQYEVYAERKYAEAKPLFQLREDSINKFLKNYA